MRLSFCLRHDWVRGSLLKAWRIRRISCSRVVFQWRLWRARTTRATKEKTMPRLVSIERIFRSLVSGIIGALWIQWILMLTLASSNRCCFITMHYASPIFENEAHTKHTVRCSYPTICTFLQNKSYTRAKRSRAFGIYHRSRMHVNTKLSYSRLHLFQWKQLFAKFQCFSDLFKGVLKSFFHAFTYSCNLRILLEHSSDLTLHGFSRDGCEGGKIVSRTIASSIIHKFFSFLRGVRSLSERIDVVLHKEQHHHVLHEGEENFH